MKLNSRIAFCFIALLFLVVGSMGCKEGDLSRSEAAKIIKKKTPPSSLFCYKVEGDLYTFARDRVERVLNEEDVVALEKKGLLKIVGETSGGRLSFQFTEKGKEFVMPSYGSEGRVRVKVAEIKEVKVIGILKDSELTRVVNHVVEFKPTLFGEVLLKLGPGEVITKKFSRRFGSYDDGWGPLVESNTGAERV